MAAQKKAGARRSGMKSLFQINIGLNSEIFENFIMLKLFAVDRNIITFFELKKKRILMLKSPQNDFF